MRREKGQTTPWEGFCCGTESTRVGFPCPAPFVGAAEESLWGGLPPVPSST